jgi:hypothetical protein
MRRDFAPESSRGLAVCWFRRILVAWVLAGLLVCAERTPDVVGHSHAHAAGHLMETWHALPGDADGETSTTSGADFHFHVMKDFTSVDSDVPSLVAPGGNTGISGGALRGDNQRIPESPVFESKGPPLIGWVA